MNAPLSLFLTHFSAAPPPAEIDAFVDDPLEFEPEPEPTVTLLVTELDAKLEAAADAARADAEQRHEEKTASLTAAHDEAMADTLATARAAWVESASEDLVKSLNDAIAALRTMLSDRVADVLRPLLADVILTRTKAELIDAVDRLLADPSQPVLRVRGPEDLGVALKAARPDAGIEWVVADTVEVEIMADATRIETKLAAALAGITAAEI